MLLPLRFDDVVYLLTVICAVLLATYSFLNPSYWQTSPTINRSRFWRVMFLVTLIYIAFIIIKIQEIIS
jgi:hypothetical protein